MAAGSENAPTSRGVQFGDLSPEIEIHRWALIIGISKYEDERLDLQFAHRDAEELSNFLKTPSGGNFEDDRILLLLNEDATDSKVRKGFRSFLKRPAKEDLILIYLACHGAPDPDRPQNLYLLPYDTDLSDIAGTAVSMEDVEMSLRRTLRAERIVMFADTCHSAGLAGTLPQTRGADSSGLLKEYLRELEASKPGFALLTSAEVYESSFEHERWGGGHGVFTHFLLEGLKGKADFKPKNGRVTVGELFEYVRNNVIEATGDKQHPSIGTGRYDRKLPLSRPGLERTTELDDKAQACFDQGEKHIAAQYWREVLTLCPSHPGARKGLEKIEYDDREKQRVLEERSRALFQRRKDGTLAAAEYDQALAILHKDAGTLTEENRNQLRFVLDLADGEMTVFAYRTSLKYLREEAKRRTPGDPDPGGSPLDESAPVTTGGTDLREPEMVRIEPGAFLMGSLESEGGAEPEQPRHEVRIAKPFAIGKYTVTFDEYDAFAEATKRSLPDDEGWGRARRPVINVTWDDAVAYAHWLSEKTGKAYRLPTEAEWEFAARAGSDTVWWFGSDEGDLANHAWFSANAGERTHQVGEHRPNPWGLYDVHGNVWEWVQDCWNDCYRGAPTDGSAWEGGDCAGRVLRGGSCRNEPWHLRSAFRLRPYEPGERNNDVGFRVAQDL